MTYPRDGRGWGDITREIDETGRGEGRWVSTGGEFPNFWPLLNVVPMAVHA